jgi:hypothetical protein
LSPGGLGAEKRTAGKDQVFALVEQLLIYNEIFLFGTDRGGDSLGRLIAARRTGA